MKDRLDHLLDTLVVEELSLESLAVREDRIAPLIDGLIRVEVRRQDDFRDAAAFPELVTREFGGFGLQVAGFTDRCPIRDVVSPVRPQTPFDDVVSILRRLSADHALPAVSLKDGIPEFVSRKKHRLTINRFSVSVNAFDAAAGGRYPITMGWKGEFGDSYEIPDFINFLVDKNVITDMSWHNNVAPSFGKFFDESETAIELWVDHPFKSMRETSGQRFAVTKRVDNDQEDDFTTDDFEEGLEKLFEWLGNPAYAGSAGVLSWNPDDKTGSPWESPSEYLEDLKEEFRLFQNKRAREER